MDLQTIFLTGFISFLSGVFCTIIILRHGHRRGKQKALLQEILSIDWLKSISKTEELIRLVSVELDLIGIKGMARVYANNAFLEMGKIRKILADAIKRYDDIKFTRGE